MNGHPHPRPYARGRRLTRRHLLTLVAVSAAASLAAACAPIQPAAPASAPTSAPAKPAADAKPAAEAKPAQQPAAQATTAPAAAAPAAKPAAEAKPAAAAKPAGEPKRGGTLKIGQQFDISIQRPHSITFQHYSVIYGVFDTLVRLDQANKPQPELAGSWEFSKDFKTLTLKLHKGVTFHTGRDLTAKDVIWNIERVRDPKASSQNLTMAKSITAMEAPDPHTLVLTFEAPRPAVFDMLDALWILDPESAAESDENKRWVGSGPFQWVSWAPGDKLELKRYDKYWKPGLPYLDGITLTVIGDAQSMTAQLRAGALDAIVNPPFEEVASLKSETTLAVLEAETGAQMYYLGLNVTTAPLDNKLVRQALNYAIDRQRIVQTSLSGIGDPSAIPWPPASLAYDAAKKSSIPFDLEKSKALLAQAGHPDGFEMPLVFNAALPGMARAGQTIQSDLAKVGVRVKIEQIEPADASTRLIQRKFTHAWIHGFGFNNLHPSTMPSVAFPWRVGMNSSYYEDPAYADLVSKLQVETDEAAAKKLAGQLTDHMIDAAFVLPITTQKRMWGLRSTVKGLASGQEDALFLEKVWLDR